MKWFEFDESPRFNTVQLMRLILQKQRWEQSKQTIRVFQGESIQFLPKFNIYFKIRVLIGSNWEDFGEIGRKNRNLEERERRREQADDV